MDSMPDDPSDASSRRPATAEIALEPLHLIERSDAVLRLGALMLASGTGSVRVKEAMQRVATALGLDRPQIQITLTEIVATTARGGIFRTQVVAIPRPGVDATAIQALERLSRTIRPGTTPAHLQGLLDDFERRRHHHTLPLVVAAAAWACLAFAFLNNGGWQECLSVGVAVALGETVRRLLARVSFNPFGVALVAAAVSCFAYLGAIYLIDLVAATGPSLHDAGYTSAVLFLVPGFPLMTATLDLARLDIPSGLSRLTYAVLIILSASVSAWAIAWAFGLTPQAAPVPPLPIPLLIIGWLVASYLGVLGFALMFNSSFPMALTAAAIGCIANTLRLIAVDLWGLPPQLAAVFATFLVGIFATIAVRRLPFPRITLSVPAMLIMIPGAAVYRALVFFNQGQVVDALQNAMQAFFIVTCLAIGLAAARILSDREWRNPAA